MTGRLKGRVNGISWMGGHRAGKVDKGLGAMLKYCCHTGCSTQGDK